MSIQAPGLTQTLSNFPRSGLEFFRLTTSIRRIASTSSRGDGHPVLTLPGYGGGDGAMLFMRQFLNNIGYNSFALGLGVNFESAEDRIRCIEDACAFREKMVDKVLQRIDSVYRQTGKPLTLIGWSMGGLYAFDAAQQAPEQVRQVFTLGTPFGDPRGTSMFKIMRAINRSNVPIETQDFSIWNNKMAVPEQSVPIKIIYSDSDGIVAPEIAQLDAHQAVEHIKVSASHVGFTHNAQVYNLIAQLLAESR